MAESSSSNGHRYQLDDKHVDERNFNDARGSNVTSNPCCSCCHGSCARRGKSSIRRDTLNCCGFDHLDKLTAGKLDDIDFNTRTHRYFDINRSGFDKLTAGDHHTNDICNFYRHDRHQHCFFSHFDGTGRCCHVIGCNVD